MQLSTKEIRQTWNNDKKKERRLFYTLLFFSVILFLFSLSFRYHAYFFPDKFVPVKYLKCLKTFFLINFYRITGNSAYVHGEEWIAALGTVDYYGAIARLKITYMALLSGGGLAIAGAIFQTIYRNPMASPNMIGATAGVNLGNVLMITFYSTASLSMVKTRYEYCYILTALCVFGVLILGKLSGTKRKNPSVMEMVMIGAVVSRGLSIFTMYYMYQLKDEDLILYQQMNLGTYLQTDTIGIIIFSTVMVIAIVPMILLRYRFNAVGLEENEARTMGVNPWFLRLTGQLCGVLMVTAAMIHCGEIGMVTLVVPHLVRKVAGSDFRKLCVYSGLIGAILVMICRLISSLFSLAGDPFPVTFILNIFLTPIFLIILAKQRRGWE